MQRLSSRPIVGGLLLVLLIGIFPLFIRLDVLSLRQWDEARRAVNAFEMYENGNWIVTHFDGTPEMWGTKPPFLIWCQTTFMHLLGVGELAVRLPSALAGLATAFLLFLFAASTLKSPQVGILAVLILLTSRGYVSEHVTRSGDFDALLTLWETAYLFVFFNLLERPKEQWRQPLLLFGFLVGLAGITKGIAGMFFLPGCFLYAWYRGALPNLFLKPASWGAIGIALTMVLGFYGLREYFNPGYLQAVGENELWGRYLITQGGHEHEYWHYFAGLATEKFLPWVYFLPLGLWVSWQNGGKAWRLATLLLGTSLLLLLILSSAETKIIWYMAPVYPSLALLAAVGIYGVWEWLVKKLPHRKWSYWIILATLPLLVWPYAQTVQRVYHEEHPSWDWKELRFRDFMRKNKTIKTYTIVHARYNAHVVFYRKLYNQRGYRIRNQAMDDFQGHQYVFGQGPLDFAPGDTVMVCESKVMDALKATYQIKRLNQWELCRMLVILDQPPPLD